MDGIDRRSLIAAGMALPLMSGAATAQTSAAAMTAWPPRETIRLWPGRPPGSPATLPTYNPRMDGNPANPELWLRGVAEPIVGVFRPERPDGRAILTIPGGGYGFVSIENEGIDVASVLNPKGITVFALAYRLPGEGWSDETAVPLQDAQRAMRLIRQGARGFGIDADRLGIVGFSAGGHLATSLTVAHDDRVYAPVDAADQLSARPAYSGLVYPVTSGRALGRPGDDSAAFRTYRRFDGPARLTSESPPLFIVHALDDPLVPLAHPRAMFDAAIEKRVPVEAHFLERGGHGFGAMNLPERAPGRTWPDLFERWIAARETA